MYENQKPLRAAARAAAEAQGYSTEIVPGSGGARLRLRKGSKEWFTLVRTSADRWMGWMRDDEGDLRGMKDADMIIAAALDKTQSDTADVFAFSPPDVERAFNANLKAREAKGLKKIAPVFVCLDPVDRDNASAVGANLKAVAKWEMKVNLGERKEDKPEPPVEITLEELGFDTRLRDSFAARVKEEFAALVGVRPEQVNVEFRVSY